MRDPQLVNTPAPRQPMRRSLRLVSLLLVLTPIVCCGGPFGLQRVYNNYRLARFADHLLTYPLPPNTEFVQHNPVNWVQPVNGGTCIVSVSAVLVSSLREEQIAQYYADVKFPRLRPPRNDPFQPIYSPSAELVQEMERLQEESRWAWVEVTFDEPAGDEERRQFTIALSEPFFNGGLDPRCEL